MNINQKLAAKAIKDATGWDAYQSRNGAGVNSAGGTDIRLYWHTAAGEWRSYIKNKRLVLPERGAGPTPEAAVAAVLPRYRSHIAALAADILPGWPHLKWERDGDALCLVMLAYGVRTVLLDGQLFENGTGWIASKYQDIAGYVSTKADIIEAASKWHAANMPDLPLPPFPGASDA